MGIKDFKPNKKSKHTEGYFKPKNPKKYVGDLGKIIYRSSYELQLFTELDLDFKVIRWQAEPEWCKVSYVDPTDGKRHTYYPDVFCEKLVKGEKRRFLIEVKARTYITPPKKPQTKPTWSKLSQAERVRKIKSYKNHLRRYIKNMAKMKAAKKNCERHGWEYMFVTETYLKRKY